MRSIGLRELKDHLSEIIREIERGEVVKVTKRGRVVAHVVPPRSGGIVQERIAIIASLDSLAAELGKHTGPSNIAETIGDLRR